MTALIFKPSKSAMQSGLGKTDVWVLQFVPNKPRTVDPLMGWTSSSDTQAQVHLEFATKEEAITYAESHGIPYQLIEPAPRKIVRKSYADNFKFGRIGRWTH